MDSRDSDNDSDADRWIELGNLGLKKSLLKSGVPHKKASRITTLLRQPEGGFEDFSEDLNAFLGVEDGVCILLATLGRDFENSTGTTISNTGIRVGESSVQLNDVKVTKVTVTQRELGALWVNLLRNPKITKLTIQFELREWESNALARDTIPLIQRPKTFLLVLPDHEDGHKFILHVEGLLTLVGQKEQLENSPIPVFSISLDLVADIVTTTTTLRRLTVVYKSRSALYSERPDCSRAANGDFGEKLANALRKNTSLDSFVLQPPLVYLRRSAQPWENLARTLLAAFAHKAEGSHDHHCRNDSPNQTISRLFLHCVSSSAVGTLCSVLRENKILKAIGLQSSNFLPQEWAQKILDSLRSNNTLEVLDVCNSKGLTEDDVFDPLMNLLQSTNSGLKSIPLHGTELVHKQSAVDEELRVNQEYRTRLASEDKITPTTGRIVLCGFQFAGKTSICKTLQKSNSPFIGWKRFLQKNPRFRQLLWGKSVHQELHNRTRGLDVTFRGQPPDMTSIWDFGGQQEFYVLHDYLFPNAGNSYFLYVCSARHPPNNDGFRAVKKERDIEGDFLFWMRFIVSNFKHLKGKTGRIHCPHVTFVMTHLDTLDDGERSRFKGLAEGVVAKFRVKFGTFLNIAHVPEFIDARFPETVENLFAGSKRHLKEILDKSEEYKVSSAVRNALQQHLIKHPYRYIFGMDEVREICARRPLYWQLGSLGGRGAAGENNLMEQHFHAGLNIVLKYLSDVGDIIFVEGLNFIIVQVTWFGREVLGHLIDPFQESRAKPKAGTGILGCLRGTSEDTGTWIPHSENGFIQRSILDRFLKNSLRKISSNDANLSGSLIDLMVHLELCFEELHEDEGTPSSDPRFFFPVLLDGSSNHVDASTSSTALQWTLQVSAAKRSSVCYVGRRLECSDELTFLTPGFFPRLQVVLVKYFRKNNWLRTAHFVVSRNIIRFAHDGMEIIVEYRNIDYFVDVLVRSTQNFQRALHFIGDHVLKKILEFCSSPQGCQGVNLVEAVIRPACVKELSPSEERRDHSVQVSYLKSKEADYVHTWEKQMPGASDCDSAADLLHGPPMTARSGEDLPNETKSSQVPMKFDFTIEDVGVIRTVEARLNTAKRIPVKFHILCDGTDTNEPHKIDGQPGRVLHILEDSERFNFPIVTFALHMLFEGTRYGLGLVKLQTPKSLEKFFDNLPRTAVLDIDLKQLQDAANIKAESSPRDILDLLEKYSSVCPRSEWWKKFLNLQNFSEFFRDFQLRQVESGSWLCKKCWKEFWLQYDH